MGFATRREFVVTLAGACLGADQEKGHGSVSKALGYADPSTEFPVLRLTDPDFTSLLGAQSGRPVGKRGTFLLISSDAGGRMEVYRLDYRSGEVRQLSEVEHLEPGSVTLLADERSFAAANGDRLIVGSTAARRTRDVYRSSDGYTLGPGLNVSEDGLYASVVERKENKYRLRLVRMLDGSATTLAEAEEEMRDPIPRPRRASVLYRRGAGLWLANYDGQQNIRLRTAEGEAGGALWAPDGRTVLYLNYPVDKRKLNNIRENTPDTKEDRPVADTTQFVSFARNADASVFVGASGSKASPHVLLLVRSVKRELTLAEHKASDPRMVAPVFSPNSQRIFFNSDRDGKPAIFSMRVDRLVEETVDATGDAETAPTRSKRGK
jgi:oligogalacturonide lyase